MIRREKEVESMEHVKLVAGFLAVLLCLGAAAGLICFCLFGNRGRTEPGGTLVSQPPAALMREVAL